MRNRLAYAIIRFAARLRLIADRLDQLSIDLRYPRYRTKTPPRARPLLYGHLLGSLVDANLLLGEGWVKVMLVDDPLGRAMDVGEDEPKDSYPKQGNGGISKTDA